MKDCVRAQIRSKYQVYITFTRITSQIVVPVIKPNLAFHKYDAQETIKKPHRWDVVKRCCVILIEGKQCLNQLLL